MSRFHKTSEKFPCLLAMKSLEISHLACTRQKRCENHSRGGGGRGGDPKGKFGGGGPPEP